MLLIDIGNSRIKWAVWYGAMRQAGAVDHGGEPPDLATLWKGLQPPTQVLVSDVRGGPLRKAVNDYAERKWCLTPRAPEVRPELAGVTTRYKTDQLGVDRWLALLAARRRHPGASLVVDCGTALTVDLLDAEGVHHGGLIAASPELMLRALSENTRLPRDPGTAVEWGLSTADAMVAGAVGAVTGLITNRMMTCPPDTKLLLTGGGAADLEPSLRVPSERWEHLVLEGLVAWWEAR